jgi:maltose alpha-D-glucosyltransferase/alpha-amylase
LEFAQEEIPPAARETIGEYIGWAELLGQRTAELHLALSSDTADTNFRPELFNEVHQAEFVESAEQLLSSTFKTLQEQWKGLPLDLREQAKRILGDEAELRKRLLAFKFHPISAMRTRIHGDYHLGQVLFTGNDFVIIDFEGEPSRSLAERRKKRSPLQDVAGMLRSFHYAAYAPLVRPQTASGDAARLNAQRTWASYWQRWVSVGFLRRYCEVAGKARFIPTTQGEFAVMLDFYLLDKAIYELSYELNNRPTWVRTPLEGIAQILGRVA